jgi:tetratricopeptide (TPR) repeat protein
MEKLIFEKLLPFLNQWKTRKGLGAVSLIILLSIPWLLQQGFPFIYLSFGICAIFFIWSICWFILSGRVMIPSSKKIVIFCFDVDSEAHKNYKRVLKRIYTSIYDLGLSQNIKLTNIAQDIITNKLRAHKYRKNNRVDLIIWGNAEYGNLNSQKVLRFELQHTMSITESLSIKLNLFLTDVNLILQKKDWTIREINELEEFKVVSDNLFETILFIIGLYFFDEGNFVESIKVFESILPLLLEKEKKNIYLEHHIQASRIRALLIDLYFLQGRKYHDEGRIDDSLNLYKKIPEHLPNPIPLYMMLGRVYYLNGDENNAQLYTEKIRKLNKRHPAVCLNLAFFGIRQKNYDRVIFWYNELLKHKVLVDVDIFPAINFLENEYNKNQSEIAYLYALGIVNGYIDPKKRISELRKFMSKAKKRNEYSILYQRAKELVS